MGRLKYLQNREIYDEVVLKMIKHAQHRIRIATANVKDVQVEYGGKYVSILKMVKELCARGVRIDILHAGIPSQRFLKDFKRYGLQNEAHFTMRRCLRVHFKCVLIDDRELFIGSPNLTGAGMGAKGEKRRNFEVGIVTDDGSLRRMVSTLFSEIWEGKHCKGCGRRSICYVPLEEPA